MDDWYNDEDWQGRGSQRPDAIPSNPVNAQPLPLYIQGGNTNSASGSTEENEFPVYGGDEEDPELIKKLIEDFQRGDDELNNPNATGPDGTSPDAGSITSQNVLSAPGDFNTNLDMLNSNNKSMGFNAVTDSANLTNKPALNNMLNTNGTAALNKALDTQIGTPKVQNLSNTTSGDDADITSDPVAAKVPYTITNKAKYQVKLDKNKKRIEELEHEISKIEFSYGPYHPELDKELQELYNENKRIGIWVDDGEASGGTIVNWTISDNLKKRYPSQSQFIERIIPSVTKIYKETGIPWQFLIAQVCNESGYGNSEIVDMDTGEPSMNLFGIKYYGDLNNKNAYVRAWTKEDIEPNKLEAIRAEHPELVVVGTTDKGNIRVKLIANFQKYDTYDHAFDGYRDTLLNNNFIHALRSSKDPVEYLKDIQSKLPGGSNKVYATSDTYVEDLTDLMKMWGMI